MTENKRFKYIRTKYRHYIQDIEKDGEYIKGKRGTYGDFDLDKLTDLLNELHEENQYLKSLKWNQDCINEISIGIQQRQLLEEENEQLKEENHGIQDKVIRLLDYVEVKQCVTRTEIKKWWNDD